MRISSQEGSLHLAGILAVIVLAIVGVAGYLVFTNEKDTTKDTTSQIDVDTTDPIQTTSDIDEASASLEEYDSELDPSQLDEDLNSLL
jgi:hypothetical protein